MAQRPEFIDLDVGSATLGALRWPGLLGTSTVVAVHGIAANAWAWDPLAHHLAGGAQVIAVDLRGRGRSLEASDAFGIHQHAEDIAAVIGQIDGPVVLIGHAMGAAVAAITADRHAGAVADVVLVDGGPPLPVADHVDADAALSLEVGTETERLRTIWPDRVSYHAMWAQHPAFVDGIGPDLERNLLADLVEVDGGFRMAVDEAAVRADGHDLLFDAEVRSVLERLRSPTTIVRAEFGPLGGPPPRIGDEMLRRYPQHRWLDADGLNHYTVINSAAGAALVADAVRGSLTTGDDNGAG